MESTRQQKISRLLQRELGEWFQKNSKQFNAAALITVTRTHISSDLSVARVYLSFFNCDAKQVLLDITKKSRYIRGQVGAEIGKQMRVVPEFHFHLDDSLDYIDNIERLLKQ
jgi:ribosome-binding factor A